MKLLVASLLVGGGSFLAADLPDVGPDECAIVSVDIERADPTLMDPAPEATALQLIVYCGHTVRSGETATKTERGLKVVEVDLEQAEQLVAAADDLLAGDESLTFD